ncbi:MULTISPECIES: response regulator [Asticcacaulis]|uniref:response regulator n=1 Tax=Asticcacaulis TaxID=76890 RepID=UPI001AEB4309|nr:response regulator [Asticcacaulis sp. BE141]MBP2160464.1 CheY-like chemotaxis protein [Asticcacaulis solisilvae]MDR6801509.1 CheY-like chemotaxis protein [Asticcacaulis sp. BE141]
MEDDAMLRFVICEVLREGHLEVVEAANAPSALRYLETTDNVDLMFTDVNMPGAIDGVDLARAVTKDFPEMTVIVTSGRPPPVPFPEVRFIPKPYVAYDVLETINVALQSRPPR